MKLLKNKDKIILDLCGGTGAWSKPYKDAGYDVRLITLPENDVSCYIPPENVYGVLSAPPCTMFSFARTNAKTPRNLGDGMKTVIDCLSIVWRCQYKTKKEHQRKPPLKFWALENPNAGLKWFLGRSVYRFQPYEFGDKYTKCTCLWGYFNEPKKQIYFNMGYKSIHHEEDWTTRNRQEIRSITPPGFARAFYEANK